MSTLWGEPPPEIEPQEDVDYWMSYSDLMAGLVLVFILLLVFFITLAKQDLEQKQQELLDQRQLLDRQTQQLETVDRDVARVLGIREQILLRVKTRFEAAGKNVSFDDNTGAIRLGSNILFREGSSRLSRKGRETLEHVIPLYYEALLGDEQLRDHVDQIVFEGHTNTNYSGDDDPDRAYLYNLRLSQRRAYEAMEYVIDSDIGASYEAKELLAANGYSSSRIIYEDEARTQEDKERSRRIEIRFRLKDERSLNQLREMFEQLEPIPEPEE